MQGSGRKRSSSRLLRTLGAPLRWSYSLLVRAPREEGSGAERVFVRLGIPLLLAVSIIASVHIARDTTEVPGVAFGNHVVFAAQLVILIFYSVLLLVVPLVRAVFSGELPVELTLRGARFRDELESSKAADKKLVERLEDVEKKVAKEVDEHKAWATERVSRIGDALQRLTEEVAATEQHLVVEATSQAPAGGGTKDSEA